MEFGAGPPSISNATREPCTPPRLMMRSQSHVLLQITLLFQRHWFIILLMEVLVIIVSY